MIQDAGLDVQIYWVRDDKKYIYPIIEANDYFISIEFEYYIQLLGIKVWVNFLTLLSCAAACGFMFMFYHINPISFSGKNN